jgi:putative ABC transport system permease protein
MRFFLAELRHAGRALLRQPVFTLHVLLTLAVGIGATTAVFSVLNAVVLEPLPYPDSARLVVLWERHPEKGLVRERVAPGKFLDWRRENQVFAGVAAAWHTPANLTAQGAPERVNLARVTASWFPTLGIAPRAGRALLADDARPESVRVAVVSTRLWQRRFGSDPKALGHTITLDGELFTIVGIMPPTPAYPEEVDVWVPLVLGVWNRVSHSLLVIARLNPGIDVPRAQADMDRIGRQLQQVNPETDRGWRVGVVALQDDLVGGVRRWFLLLAGSVALVLLVGCANVANLFAARGIDRQREIAIRAALGAGRGQLAFHVLAESLVLSAVGGVLGVLGAALAVRLFAGLIPATVPRVEEVGVDARVLAFSAGLSLVVAALAGFAPALQATGRDLAMSQVEGSRGGMPGRRVRRFQRGLVVSEVAMAFVLLVGAGLVIQSLIGLQHVDPGFRTGRVLTARVSLPLSLDRYRKEASRSAFWQLLLVRVDGLPGVEAAGLTSSLPFGGTEVPFRFRVEGRPADTFADLLEAEYRAVSPSYFRVMGIALRDGRAFSDRDGHDGAGVAIVNDTMAHRLSGWRLGDTSGRGVLGQRISVQGPDGPWWPIVGVVADVRHVGLDTAARPEIYVPFVQEGWPEMTVVVRTAGEPLALAEPLRRLVQQLDPEEPVHHVSALADLVDRSLSTRRFSTTLLTVFAAAALLLSMIGIHGVLSYLVSRRRHEIGVRMAIGATRRDVVGLVLAEGLRLTLAGEIVGLVLALVLARALASVLFGVGSRDPLTLAALFITLALTALVAMLVPARRAAGVDPLMVLRHE